MDHKISQWDEDAQPVQGKIKENEAPLLTSFPGPQLLTSVQLFVFHPTCVTVSIIGEIKPVVFSATPDASRTAAVAPSGSPVAALCNYIFLSRVYII